MQKVSILLIPSDFHIKTVHTFTTYHTHST